MTDDGVTNTTITGRLLEEIFWEGKRVGLYRRGGRDMEKRLDLRSHALVSWITWTEVQTVGGRQPSSMKIEDPSLRGTVERLGAAVSSAIAMHS